MSDAEKIPQTWVYVGRVKLTTGKIGTKWLPVTTDGVLADEAHVYYEKRIPRRVVGAIYEVNATPDGSAAVLSDLRFVQMHGDGIAVMQWQTADRALAVAEESKRAEKKIAPEALAALEPIRRQYRKTFSNVQRMAIELQVLAYLRSTKSTEE